MALHVPKAPGFTSMLKEGARSFSGLEEAVFRNISACKEFTQTVKSAYGPNGMNKMIINHIDKMFVTSDAATITRELDVEHPAVRLMIIASEMQDNEVGDGTNFVLIFAGSLLEAAEELLRLGITAVEIAEGYEKALAKALELLDKLVCDKIEDTHNISSVKKAILGPIMSKQYGNEELLATLVAKACVSIMPERSTFNVDNIRVCKILGSGLASSTVLNGMVFKREVEGAVTSAKKAKVAVYGCAVDIIQTETKGTVLIKSADELLNFSRDEENMLEAQIKSIVDTGVKVIVAGAKFGDMALHYLNKYEIMAVRLNSKFDLRRLARAVNATVLPRLTPPTAEELGYCDEVGMEELGDTTVVSFKQLGKDSRIATIVIRGATDNHMDDIERAVDDGVNTFKNLCRDGRLLTGAGACEIDLSHLLDNYANTLPGLDQYAVRKFSQALEALPKALSDNSGLPTTKVLEKLHEAHRMTSKTFGIDIKGDMGEPCDAKMNNIYDHYLTKQWGLKYAVEAACTVLRVDQIICAKRSGGPAPRPQAAQDADED